MKHSIRAAAATLIAAAVATAMGVASADDFVNNLDTTLDSTLETMNLTFDSVNNVGTDGDTTITIFQRGVVDGDHPGCNIQGGPHYVTITATSSAPAVADVVNGPDYTFDTCSDGLVVTVQAYSVGTAIISFAVNDSLTNNDPHLTFDTAPADFQVNVTEGTVPSTGCDKDPAAPAWAAAILMKSGYKLNSKQVSNWVSIIANEMTYGADFGGYEKGDHPYYENAVHDRLQVLTGKSLVSAQSAARPGWVCGPI